MLEIHAAFAAPIATTQLNDAGPLNRQLRELFLQCEAQGDKFANPEPYTHRNQALFESRFTLFDWQKSCIEQLRTFCWSTLYRMIGDLNGYGPDELQRLHIAHESWFHVTRKGGYFGVHNHPMHSWSGVYCVCQEGDDPTGDSGKLTLINPNAMHTAYVDMTTHKMKRPYSMGNLPLRLAPGQLIIFPSWMLHEVTPFEPLETAGEAVRITVAFNARFMMSGFAPPAPMGEP